jgi:AcrR family transcriptional regulator
MTAMTELSIPGIVPSDVAAGRRPRNRKATIATVAAALIAENGFDGVRMDDIAVASGITVRALYRHFANKVALLTALVESSQERFLAAVNADGAEAGGVDDSSADDSGASRFTATVERLVLASDETAHFAVLWQREARHLVPEDLSRLRHRLSAMVAAIAAMIGSAAPDLSEFQCELRAWATIATMVVPRAEVDAGTAAAGARTLLAAGPRPDLLVTALDGAAIAADETLNRRERLLASAAARFARAGFASTGIEDIGRAAGVSGPSLYRHFGSKSEILDTLAERRSSWLWYAANAGWAPDRAPGDRLRGLTEAFITTAVRTPDLVGIWVTESRQLSEPVRQKVASSLASFHGTWSTALHDVRPGLSPTTCARLVRLAVQVVEDTVRIRHLQAHPRFAGELAAVVNGVLLSAAPAAAE